MNCRVACVLLSLLTLVVLAPGRTARADDSACIKAAKETSVRCWSRCSDDDEDALKQCTDRCEAALETHKQRCQSASSAAAQGSLPKLSGVTQNGQDGCYFGECPPDLDKRIGESKDSPEEPPPRKPAPRTVAPANSSSPTNAQPLVRMTGICQTPYFYCQMLQIGLVGSSCWCGSLYGPVIGVTVPQR